VNTHAQLVLSGVALLGVTALATIAPFLDDIVRGLRLGGGIDTTGTCHRYQRTGRGPFPLIARWTIVGAFLATRVRAGDRTTTVNFTHRTLLAFLVAFVLSVPSILVALQLGASGLGPDHGHDLRGADDKPGRLRRLLRPPRASPAPMETRPAPAARSPRDSHRG
jgi:hypothetical protein